MLRGTIDPKEPPVYEYVKFIGNFKSLNNGKLQYTESECRAEMLCERINFALFPFFFTSA